jgi:hypothetical protein
MAGLEPDVSSYNQPLPVSPLDVAGKVGSLQQQKLSIDQAKLDQANQGLTYMTRAMGALGPDATKEQYIKAAEQAVKMGLVPPQQLKVFAEKAAAAPDSKSFFNEFMTSAATAQEQIALHIGRNKDMQDQKNIYSGVERSPLHGGGFSPATRMPVQIAPGTPGYNPQNEQVFEQPEGPSGVVPVPRARQLPVERPPAAVSGPTGPTRDITAETPTSVANRLEPLKAGPSPLFAEGKESYTKDQLLASGKAQAIKPAIQALKLMKPEVIATGPGTAQFNDLVAAAKAWGLVNIKEDTDPTVIRQELEKKLAQYVGSSPIGQRSDAAQTLAEAGSPNPKKQILPALQNLTRDAIALDRVQMLQPQAFKGSDYQNYVKHKGTFPNSIDEKALTLDLIDEGDRKKLITKMANQYKNGNASEKKSAEKFLNTLKLAQEAKIYELD